ncbi:MAG TPA: O-antigen ligase family protein, partial [Pyrinomonadaceae bacterium]|nr:O-antigen ligase family protein [Pyrinomonadaceae bacterium]
MGRFFEWLDGLAGIDANGGVLLWLERAIFIFLVLMVVSASHSIAATQTAWLTGMFLWLVLVAVRRKLEPTSRKGDKLFRILNLSLWAFFFWSVITSFTSYAPDISIDKLRGVSVFLIFYFVYYSARNLRAVHFLAFTLVVSCMVNVLWVPVQRLIGRGVEIHGLAADGAMAKALLWEGDTLLEANGKKVYSPEDVLAAVEQNEMTKVKFYRPDFDFVVDVKRADLLQSSNAMEQLGFSSWKKSRNWRSTGFYGHYTTYAEVLQLIASLVLGLFVASIGRRTAETQRRRESEGKPSIAERIKLLLSTTPFLLFSLAAMCLALLLTVTRASQLAFMISAAVIVVVGLGRKWLLRGALIGLPVMIIGLLFLQQSRQVGFFDTKDDSIRWRETVWHEGFELWKSSPRNFVLGVGMDSIKRYAPEWHLFGDGRLNMGHFHSTPLQLLVERGFPALLIWLVILGVYLRMLWQSLS